DYSTFLTELYSELMLQAQSLVAEGINNLHKLLRMRARPKVLHARTYEEAITLYRRLEKRVFAVITDVRYSRGGEMDPEAGFRLVETIRAERPNLPLLVQSADVETAQRAADIGVLWVDKNSPSLLRQLRQFVSEHLGFGDFIFRMPDFSEAARARDMFQMEQVLATVPDESLAYHTARNDLAVWFTARSMFDLADMVRPDALADFETVDETRAFLLELMYHSRMREQDGRITDLSSRPVSHESSFVRIGTGSIGGKARGIAFANSWLVQNQVLDEFEGLDIRIPRTLVIGTEDFDLFLEHNGIAERLAKFADDRELTQAFLDGDLSDEFREDLHQVWQHFDGPVAVRSSSLLEDLQFQPFSGVYATYMLPNNHPDMGKRFEELCRAIKAVYASTYCENARSYIANTAFRHEEEKMGIVIQEMVGQEKNDRYYPHISGVALSYNFYPVDGQKPEDGTALAALGLGHMVVTGGAVLRFSPTSPGVLPQFKSASDYARLSQRQFFAVDMTKPEIDFLAGVESSLSLYDLSAAEEDGSLTPVGSVYSPDDDTVRDSLKAPGQRIVTLNNVLKWNAIPLAPALKELLRVLGQGMGCAVEIEFAVDMADWGKPTPRGRNRETPTLYVLQIRPLATHFLQQQIDIDDFPAADVLCRSNQSLGHGVFDDVHDLVYIRRDALEVSSTQKIGEQIGAINAELRAERAPYVLVGPGRWGSSDPRLGIPVEWRQISGARVIAETPLEGRKVEPSQGTHFFQNITSLGIGYLTLDCSSRQGSDGDGFIDTDWLDLQDAVHETSAVRHIRFDDPMRVYLDGRRGRATILRPAPVE
ncbi:MAG: PEP/pyruvate-binding domain-containing protein, partial [Myxococcota bacterium]